MTEGLNGIAIPYGTKGADRSAPREVTRRPHTRLTSSQRREVLRAAKEGEFQHAIAKRFGVAQSTVSALVRKHRAAVCDRMAKAREAKKATPRPERRERAAAFAPADLIHAVGASNIPEAQAKAIIALLVARAE